jgi:class 3 adenylate cyclase
MTSKFARGVEALISLEDVDGLTFMMHGNVRAPMRRLWPLTIFAATIIGIVIGLTLGVATDHLLYYLFKETLNGIIAGIFAPFFLLVIRRVYSARNVNANDTATPDSRTSGYLFYMIAGALAGGLNIGMEYFLPPMIPWLLSWGLWLLFYPVGSAILFPIVASIADYAELLKIEQRRTNELFGKYVSEAVAMRILEKSAPITFTGERRECTVLFSDIRGFTRMVKDTGAEQVVQTLNEYFSEMIDIIFQFDGMVNKFIGDAIVVLYGAPLSTDDEALRAVRTAQAMNRVLKSMNEKRQSEGKPSIHIGIGIDSGPVVVGNIGSPRRLEYTAIGEPVNNATWLGGLAPMDTVYISENVYRQVKGCIAVRPWQVVQLKGGTGETMVYIVEDTETN